MRISPAQIGFLFFLLCRGSLMAQDYSKFSYYGGLHQAVAAGDYGSYLKAYEAKTGRVGVYGGFLFNPSAANHLTSPVFLGLEIGGNGWGSETVPNYYGAAFTQKYRSFYTHLVSRYRPFTGPVKVSPFLDISAGPYWAGSVVQEMVSQDEYNQIFRFSKMAKSFGLGAGAGFGRRTSSGRYQFIDLGVYYQGVEKMASVRRMTIFIDQYDEATYAVQVIKPDTWKIRLNLTGFL